MTTRCFIIGRGVVRAYTLAMSRADQPNRGWRAWWDWWERIMEMFGE